MSLVFQPTGLRVVGNRSSNAPYEGGTTLLPLTTNNANPIGIGDPVALIGGSIVNLAANPVAGTLSTNTVIGVVAGFQFVPPTSGILAFLTSQVLPANAITAGYTNVFVQIFDDPAAKFTVAANGVITLAQIGATIGLAGFGTADTQYKKTSLVYADTATILQNSGATNPLRIVGIDHSLDNISPGVGGAYAVLPGDVYTKVYVSWTPGSHAYSFAGTQ